MGLVAGGQKVGRNVAFASDISHDFDVFFDLGKLGKELCLGIAFQNICRNCVARNMGVLQAIRISVIKEHLRFQHLGGLLGCRHILAQCKIQQYLNRRAALHMRQQLKGKFRRDFFDFMIAKNDLLEELRLVTCRAGCAGQCIVNEELQ